MAAPALAAGAADRRMQQEPSTPISKSFRWALQCHGAVSESDKRLQHQLRVGCASALPIPAQVVLLKYHGVLHVYL